MNSRHKIGLAVLLSLLPAVPHLLTNGPSQTGPDFVSAVPSPLVTRTQTKMQTYTVNTDTAPTEMGGQKSRTNGRPYIVIDTHTNRLYYRTADSVLFAALCSTGSGAELVDTGTARTWRFDTPKGIFHIDSKLANPWWRKPDWAFVEEGERPPVNDGDRMDPYVLGDYALGFGDGYYIHGTLYERLIGISITHGCVRLSSDDIKRLYNAAKIGTTVVIY